MKWADRALLRLQQKQHGLYKNKPFDCHAFHAAPADRNLLIFVDGTNNDPSTRNKARQTNVYRMSQLVDSSEDRSRNKKKTSQKVIYQEGVGSDMDDPNYVSAFFRQIGGLGLNRILDQTYLRVIKHYHPGDRIFIFGFSRGAIAARMLANRLASDGIPERGFARYADLGNNIKGESILSLQEIAPEGGRINVEKIEVLGLWDSVASVGFLERLWEGKPRLDIPEVVNQVYHLVSIDENRFGFGASLIEPAERVEEIWFPGVHSDVGGGYRRAGLANVALHFMMHRLREAHQVYFHAVPECPECQGQRRSDDCLHDECYEPNAMGRAHSHPTLWPKRKRRIEVRGGDRAPRFHQSVVTRLETGASIPGYARRQLLALRDTGNWLVEPDQNGSTPD